MKNIFKTIYILSILFISCSKTDEVSSTILPTVNENKILFDAKVGSNSNLFTMNIDGTNEKQITNFTDGINFVSAYQGSWSTDGTKIIFLSNKDKDGGSKIYTINSDGTNLVRLNNNARGEDSPKFSPDGTKIIFDANVGNNSHLFIMNIDGTNEKQITNFTDGTNYVSTYEGSWSPDGTKIIFLSDKDKDGGSKIYIINSDGTNVVRINHNTRHEGSPKFSPDGKKILFDAKVGSNSHLFTMNIDGANEKQITNFTDGINFVSTYEGSWSPDGTKIIFLSDKDKDGGSKIYIINSDGTNWVRINHNARGEDSPSWK